MPGCLFCSAPAVALIEAAEGCLCSARRWQYRCAQHMLRADDTGESYVVVATFGRMPR